VVVWTNGGHNWIQHVKYVQGAMLMNLLTVVLMVFMGDKVVGAEFRKSESGRMFSMAGRQPVVVWTKGGYSWIQRIE